MKTDSARRGPTQVSGPNLWTLALVGFAALTLCIGLALLGACLTDSRGADLAGWIEAVATALALIAAAIAAVYAASAYGLEREREEAWRTVQRSEQAAKVAAWIGVKDLGASENKPARRIECVYFRNASDIPVTAVEIELSLSGEAVGSVEQPVLPPTAEPAFKGLTPEDVKRVKLLRYAQPEGTEVDVVLRFTDAAGIRWERKASHLQEVRS